MASEDPPVPGGPRARRLTLLEMEPQRKLRYTWVVGEMETIGTFTLTSTAAGTRLYL